MEPPPNVDPIDGNKDLASIYREIESDAAHILAQNSAIQNPYSVPLPHPENGFVVVDSSFLDNRPPVQYFGTAASPYGAHSVLSSVASPPSVLSSAASPMSVSEGYLDPAIGRPGTEMSNGWLPSPAPPAAAAATCVAQLVITEQPVERCRFRYRAEHSPHGALRGADKRQKSCPKIKVLASTIA